MNKRRSLPGRPPARRHKTVLRGLPPRPRWPIGVDSRVFPARAESWCTVLERFGGNPTTAIISPFRSQSSCRPPAYVNLLESIQVFIYLSAHGSIFLSLFSAVTVSERLRAAAHHNPPAHSKLLDEMAGLPHQKLF